jgi:hypothetical protein
MVDLRSTLGFLGFRVLGFRAWLVKFHGPHFLDERAWENSWAMAQGHVFSLTQFGPKNKHMIFPWPVSSLILATFFILPKKSKQCENKTKSFSPRNFAFSSFFQGILRCKDCEFLP